MHTKTLWFGALVAIACSGHRPPPDAARPPAKSPPAASAQNPVAIENDLRGSDRWQLAHRAPPGALEGYAGAPSVQHGEALAFHVRADGPHALTWTVWRMGWYGGAQGRLVASGGAPPGPAPPPAPPEAPRPPGGPLARD